jgi:predicted Rossmann-fold nucleotide-binding protein
MPVIPAIREMGLGGLRFKVSPGKKLARPISTNELGVVVHGCNPCYMGGICRGTHDVRLAPGKRVGEPT